MNDNRQSIRLPPRTLEQAREIARNQEMGVPLVDAWAVQSLYDYLREKARESWLAEDTASAPDAAISASATDPGDPGSADGTGGSE